MKNKDEILEEIVDKSQFLSLRDITRLLIIVNAMLKNINKE